VDLPRLACTLALAFVVAGCGASPSPPRRSSLFSYDATAPLRYADRGRVNTHKYPLAVHDVSYSSGGRRVECYLVLPPGRRRHPAVVFVHGSGGDRRELLPQAGWLAARNVVTLTITAPSATARSASSTPEAALAKLRATSVADVVAVRRAVDLLRSLAVVDPARIGYVGWSAGARTGTLLAAAEPRLRALVLLSAGAAPVSAYAAAVPPALRAQVRRVLGSVDPLRYVARARPGSLLLEDGRRDRVVPRAALLNVVHAAPRGTAIRWYDAPHALDRKAYRDAFAWLARKLPILGAPVRGAAIA
jgi:poly(3-hydroxybutyrate) depolymerase